MGKKIFYLTLIVLGKILLFGMWGLGCGGKKTTEVTSYLHFASHLKRRKSAKYLQEKRGKSGKGQIVRIDGRVGIVFTGGIGATYHY